MKDLSLSRVRVKPAGFTLLAAAAFSAMLLTAPALSAAEPSLLKNSDFSETTSVGLPLHWSARTKEVSNLKVIPTDKGNAVRMTPMPKERMFLIQWSLPLTPGKLYRVSYEVRSAKKSEHRVYCEWRNEFKKLTCNDGSWNMTAPEWTEQSFIFTYPEKSTGAYLVVSPDAGGELEIRNIKLELSKEQNVLKNPDFLIRNPKGQLKNWSHLGFKGSSFSAANKVMTLNSTPDGKACVVAQWDINIVPGRSYEITAEVRATSPGSFRIYSEWRIPDPANPKAKGRLSSYGGWWRSVGTEWKKDTIVVNYPENCRGAYLVLSGRVAKSVEFRNVRIVEKVNHIPKEAAVAGGTWALPADAAFAMEKGKAVLTIAPKAAKKSTVQLNNIKVTPGKRYALVYTIQGKGAAGSDTGFHPFRISVSFPGVRNDGAAWDDTQNGVRTKQVEFTVPEKLTGKTANVTIETTTRGAIALWDISLKELPPKAPEVLTVDLASPFFRDVLFGNDREKSVAGTVSAKAADADVKLLDSTKAVIASCKVRLSGGKGTFSIPAAKLADGKYQLEISAKVNGKVEKITREIAKVAPRKNQVEFNGKNFYAGNKVFYPVISWTIAGVSSDRSDDDIERGFYHAARNGINCMIFRGHSAEDSLRYLNAADKYGIKLFFATGNPPSANANTLALWEHQLYSRLTKEVINHPALFGYFLVDEPYWRGIPSAGLIAAYKILKHIDPYHPVWINAAPRGTVEVHKEYSKAVDIYGVDVYPIPQPSSHSGLDDKGMTSVGKYVFRMNEACGGNWHKPIIMALQAFSWGVKKVANPIYPTFDELRFMTYDSITAGAIGVSYWGSKEIHRKDFYTDVYYPVTRELQQVSGILTSETAAKVSYDAKLLRIFARKYNGKNYLIAINLTPKAVNAVITTEGKKFTVVNEDRSVTAVNGKLNDKFAPYGVHIYAEGPLPPPAIIIPEKNTAYESKGDPALIYVDEQNSLISYSGKAEWIWADGFTSTPFAKVCLSREFTLTKPVKKAVLIISADDTYKVWINGQSADKNFPKSGVWNMADAIDVTKFLKPGKNTITVIGEDGGTLPCGVLADLTVTAADNSKFQLITDKSWHGAASGIKNWQNPEVFSKWPKAVTVAPYGSGSWGNRMQLKNSDILK